MNGSIWRLSMAAALVFLLFASGQALADNAMSCGQKLVMVGDTKTDVLSKCGPPDYQEMLGVEKTEDTVVKIEQWQYDFGPRNLIRILTFKAGRLATIELGPYGRKTTDR
ncbi:MAG: DUF2845 domain-containing protein [Proteobacteria bacterium]|nr:DUF2845 domain-containing protein [Pseudomonadota bacterium]